MIREIAVRALAGFTLLLIGSAVTGNTACEENEILKRRLREQSLCTEI